MVYIIAFLVSWIVDILVALWMSWLFNLPFLLTLLLTIEVFRRINIILELKKQREEQDNFAKLLEIARNDKKNNNDTTNNS